jgi:putative ABC transport system permease protein
MVLALLLHGSLLIGSLILLMMAVAAATTAARRLKGMAGALWLCFCAIAAGAGTVIAAMLVTRSLQSDITMLVPVGSMIIANAMNACAQAVERFRAEILSHVGPAAQLALRPGEAPASQSRVEVSAKHRLELSPSNH